MILLRGGGESLKRSQKITGRGRGGSPKDHRGSRSQEGSLKKIGKIEGAHKENNYSQDQISVGDSGCDIFIDQH